MGLIIIHIKHSSLVSMEEQPWRQPCTQQIVHILRDERIKRHSGHTSSHPVNALCVLCDLLYIHLISHVCGVDARWDKLRAWSDTSSMAKAAADHKVE